MTAHELAVNMQAYMDKLDKKPIAEQKKIAKQSLIDGGLIDENGEFTDHYAYSREYYREKQRKK
ncbi:MAG: hypothetical protein LBN34_08565 [Clostridiales Family XIII bacterium]|jgi:hypothetical protein|nr:hypothetical protein [Clostridiales Family XIII bacterium]